MISKKEIRQVAKKSAEFVQVITAARYLPGADQIKFTTPWLTFRVDRQKIDELRDVSTEQLMHIYASVAGIHINRANIDIDSSGLILELVGPLMEAAQRNRSGKF